MMSFSRRSRVAVRFVAVFGLGLISCAGDALAAASSAGESAKVQPDTGPAILLDEPEKVDVEPKLVTRQTLKEKLGEGSVEREIAHYSDNSIAADGSYKEFHPNGKPFIEGQFKKGRQEGEWKYYFDNGQLNRKMTFKDGKPNGSWEINRADGTLQAKRGFKEGMRDGEWTNFDATGKQPLSEEHYVAGEQDGVWKTWYPNGQQKMQVSFKKGKRDGATLVFDDKGKKLAEEEYSDGKLNGTATRYLPDGKKITLVYEAGKLKSESKQ